MSNRAASRSHEPELALGVNLSSTTKRSGEQLQLALGEGAILPDLSPAEDIALPASTYSVWESSTSTVTRRRKK